MDKHFDPEFYKKILSEINSNVYITDVETDEIVYMNEYMKKTFGLEHPEGKICWQVLQKGATGRCAFCPVSRLTKKDLGNSYLWRENNTLTGRQYMNYDILEKAGDRWYHAQNSVDITEYMQLSMEASTDELTGVMNRSAGKKKLEITLKDMLPEDRLIVALYDINGLKWVNDTYGHVEGDRLLTFASDTIQRELSGEDFLFRLSGDEFIIVFKNRELSEAEQWMKRILRALAERRASVGLNYDVTFSYGFAEVLGNQHLTVSDVLSIADTQMYMRKREYYIHKGFTGKEKDQRKQALPTFQYNKDALFEVLSESEDDYVFAGNLKTGQFMYSYKMMLDFGLPAQIIDDAALFWGDRIHPEDKSLFIKSNQEIARGETERHTIVYRAKDRNGRWVHLMCHGHMVRDENGTPDLFAGIIRNLDKKTATINDELRIISDSSTDGIFKAAMTEGFPVLYANDGYLAIHGYTRKQLAQELDNLALPLVYEVDLPRITKELEQGIAEQSSRIILEYRIKRRDGNLAWVHVNGGITRLDDGTMAMIGMVMDITERKKLEERLTHTEQLFHVARKYSRLNMWELDIRKKQIIQTEESRAVHGGGILIENIPESLIESKAIHPDSVEAIRKLYRDLEEGERVSSCIIRVSYQGEPYWWEKVTYTVTEWHEGRPIRAVGISEDVTAQKAAERRVFEEESMRDMLQEQDMMFSFRLNVEQDCLEDFWDYRGDKLVSLNDIRDIKDLYQYLLDTIANEDDGRRFQSYYKPEQICRAALDGEKIPNFEFRQKQMNGIILWVELNMRVTISPDSSEHIIFGYVKNINSLKKRELSLKQKAETDHVTGLYNYNTAKLLIGDCLLGAPKESSAIALLDIDYFKEINRRGGYLAGDELLRAISSDIVRSVPSSVIKARVERDTFLLYFQNLSHESELKEQVEELRRNLSRRYQVGTEEVEVTLTAGICMQFSEGMTFRQLYQYALHALKGAKRRGKNCLLMYRELEDMKQGFDIQMTIDASTYEILDMNTTGQIAFGVSGFSKRRTTCYELLHNRTEPCPFCMRNLKAKEDEIWKCFVPRLNKVMYIKEHQFENGQSEERTILLRESTILERRKAECESVLYLLKESWSRIEQGARREETEYTFLEYIGMLFDAKRTALYGKKHYSNRYRLERMWKMNGVKDDESIKQDAELLKKLLVTVYPDNKILIEDESSLGYDLIAEFYGDTPVPLPILLAGSYESGGQGVIVLLEHAAVRRDQMELLALLTSFLHKMDHVYELNASYNHALQHDQLTGVFNYQSFLSYLQEVDEDVYSSLGLVQIQAMNLKSYNEEYGRRAGDELLVAASEVLTDLFEKDLVFRSGGGRFMALCPDVTYENFSQRCRELQERLGDLCDGMFVSAHAWESSAISVEKMQSQVEEKIQIAVGKLRNGTLEGGARTVEDMKQGLKKAIADGCFYTYLQPKAMTDTKQICGAEALIRYCDRERGIISPARFLPPIEKAGLVRYIDLFVLESVCRSIQKWLEKGWDSFPISLNFSRATILEPEILEETDRIVERYGIPKELLEIEVTESIGSIDNKGLQTIVDRFVQAGYRIALDDFGAEYSNIYVLYSLKLNSLKLDRRIVSDIYHDSRARLVVEHMIEMCKKMGIKCVAEGVETEEHLSVLREMGCDVIQGYYLNKPLPEEEFFKLYVTVE